MSKALFQDGQHAGLCEVAVGCSTAGKVMLQFAEPIQWVQMSTEQARCLADALMKNADYADQQAARDVDGTQLTKASMDSGDKPA